MSIHIGTTVSSSRAAMWSLALVAPAAAFLLANLLNEAGIGALYGVIESVSDAMGRALFNVISPVVFLGGLAAAVILNGLAIAELDVNWQRRRVVGTLTLQPRALNVVLLAAAGVMLATFAVYGFLENFAIVRTHL